jgi:hypothetical protein
MIQPLIRLPEVSVKDRGRVPADLVARYQAATGQP